MSTHYNAFISYKHAELDNKIAAMVERGLEHYHIPRKIQKKTGIKRIERIFRDTDELPITSDLSGTIAEALENADYLIVICSTNTCKSMWVEREIKLFLQNHTQDQILTVLADGEPVDVVPEILKNKEVIRVNDLGIEETVTIPVEPLSCDFRLPKREAFNTELPRLAAALVGCGYNELMDRQRQYKMKRLTAVFAGVMAIALGFAGYMFYSRNQINESYRASLISQSKYLANESERLLKNQDRIDALHLALNALPNEEMPDRPVTIEAVRALTRATLAYKPGDSSNIGSLWNYELPNSISKMGLSSQADHFIAIDYKGNVKIWDTATHDELYSFYPKDKNHVPSEYVFIEEEKAIILGSKMIRCISLEDGSVEWENDSFEDESISVKPIVLTKEGNILVLAGGSLRVYSTEDGNEVERYAISQEVLDMLLAANYIDNIKFSPDYSKIAYTYTTKEDKAGLAVFDISTGNTIYKTTEYNSVKGLSYPKDGQLFFAGDTIDITDINDSSYSVLNMHAITEYSVNVFCFDPDDLSEKWENELTCDGIYYDSHFIYIPDTDYIYFFMANVCDCYDLNSGERIHHYSADTPLIFGYFAKDNPNFITHNGGIAMTSDFGDKDVFQIIDYFSDNLTKAAVGKGVYTVENNSNRVVYYGVGVCDKEWTSYENSPQVDSLYNSYLDDNAAAVIYDKDEEVYLDVFDPNSKAFVKSIVFPEEGDTKFDYSIRGSYQDKLLIIYTPSGIVKELILYSVDCKTGEYTRNKIGKDNPPDTIPKLENGKFVFVDRDSLLYFIRIYDIAKDKYTNYRFPTDDYNNVTELFYFEKQGYIYASGNQDFIVDINENETYPVDNKEDWDRTWGVSMNEDGSLIAISNKKDIVIKDIKGKDIAEIPCLDVGTQRPFFYKEKGSNKELLIVPFVDGSLCRYDALTGELIGKTGISTDGTPDLKSTVTIDRENSCIYLCSRTITNIIDMDSYLELAYITGSLGYHKPTDTFVCIYKDDEHIDHLGYFRRYTLDDLIKKAKDLLMDHEMPQEQKDAYGIG
ncbi:toll/interleukin-1 receptor domain-containing protein [Butyrivibrio sp. X503]|uniref:toll/interleukin-1 receptor domain-containing protein n=1 Tax=Butyrivibrio sp. X503 TaxID=2364878 RepID=UPI000EA8AA38|nr:toll/interleukin-1 receptor domain-containing protein [Butyrivibrio sp. X503]RKM55122.1 toll/interleukin-1 receptor domain-containing protein [Butyrivibrio sp. X503]